MKFGSVYLVIGKEPTVYTIDHLTKVFKEKCLVTLLPRMAHLPQIPLYLIEWKKKCAVAAT